MKTKIEKNYTYNGLLFPIKIPEVEMFFYEGEWHPRINVLGLSEQIVQKLALSNNRLLGTQVKFIRSYFNMSLRDFASKIVGGLSHEAVNKWEKRGDLITNMDINVEKIIKLYICEKTMITEGQESSFFKSYKKIRSLKKNSPSDKGTGLLLA
jgi:DNA-binding transcriptional regulator YiaG